MTRPSDETLLQYVDGTLTEAERARVEAAVMEDPNLRVLTDAMRESQRLAKVIYDRPMREPVPQSLVDAIISAPTVESRRKTGLQSWMRVLNAAHPSWATAMAASLALLVGAAAGYMAKPAERAISPGLIALGEPTSGGALERLLENGHSGSVAPGDGGLARHGLTVVATFIDRQKRPCREIEVLAMATDGTHPVAVAMACRANSGKWIVEGAVRLAGQGTPAAPGYEPSGMNEKDAVEGLLTMLGAGKALTSDDERSLIARSWRVPE